MGLTNKLEKNCERDVRRGRIVLRGEESPGEKMNAARWKCCKKKEGDRMVEGRQTSEGVYGGRGFKRKKKGKVKEKNSLD